MKKIGLIISALALMAGVQAQSIYDATRFVGSDLNGTARFVGMGGAMGALGGDISTISTNPAGIGIYRSNDIMTSFGFNYTGVESNYKGSVYSNDRTRMSFDNFGFVYSNKVGNQTPLRYVNFAFNYHKSKNFNRSMLMSGNLDGSQSDQMAALSKGVDPEYFDTDRYDPFLDEELPWIGILGYQGYLISPDDENNYYGYLPDDRERAKIDGLFRSQESGGINSYNFNIAFNLYDQLYIGATFGVHDVDYNLKTAYGETFLVNEEYYGNYTLNSRLNAFGTGVDFKLGVIVRPSVDFPLRIGAAVHTPTFYRLTDRNFAWLQYDTQFEGQYNDGIFASQDGYGYDMNMETDYRVTTPWKFDFSLGYTIGNSVAIGAEYDFADYSGTRMKRDYDGYTENMTYENAAMKDMLKAVHNLRLGIEARLVPEFSVRAGYNYSTAAFEKGAYKSMQLNAVRTDTDFTNDYSKNAITLGMGYKDSSFYADLAYQYGWYKSDFYAFDHEDLVATKLTNDRHQLLMTLGFRF